jgi:hypothetical protein
VRVWYSTITVYVAIKGAGDIKNMLARLGKRPETPRSRKSKLLEASFYARLHQC